MTENLQKPDFIKIKAIQPAKHCYHVYCKILSAVPSELKSKNGKVIPVVEGVVADETGAANYRLTGSHAANIKEGKIIALRNGKSSIVAEQILLELYDFGGVTEEADVNISQVNTDNNISDTKWEKKKA